MREAGSINAPPRPLRQPQDHQRLQVLGQAAQAHAEQSDGEQEDAAGAPAVGGPAGEGQEQGQPQQVAGDSQVQVQHRRFQRRRHGGQRGPQHGGVQVVLESSPMLGRVRS
jgi:hypothetical protein